VLALNLFIFVPIKSPVSSEHAALTLKKKLTLCDKNNII
jgi:hypothetical protein